MIREALKTRTARVAVALAVIAGLALVTTGARGPEVELVAKKSATCKDVVLVGLVQLVDPSGKVKPTTAASVPYRVRPCGNQNPGQWAAFTSAPTTTAPGDALAFELQGIDIRLEGVGANSKSGSSAHYKGVVKLTQKAVNVPLLPVAPLSLRTITLAIKFTVYHQKKNPKAKSRNVRLDNFIKVTDEWSSHPGLVKFDWKKGGYVR
ncbi:MULTISPECIES: hypothetical protein [unclassified Saccharothrix]|uniref:hypothetical protein n=1 Tax=unclassified Saccharothrix TaxID=2593673 RepID=UPI00307D91BE